jgi:Na+-transporting NADH:ubiquinone oxidoreductase subunit B/electron transport complex protein RnfD
MSKIFKSIETVLNKNLNKAENFVQSRPKVNFLFGALFEACDGLIRSTKDTAKTPPYIRSSMDVKRFLDGLYPQYIFMDFYVLSPSLLYPTWSVYL